MINQENTIKERNHTLDILRGLAIFTMILSNYAGEMLKAPHPYIISMIGSLAAPLFVLIAGFLVGNSVLNKHYPLSYFLLRGFLTWIVAATIDLLLWKSYPFISVDILYLTGFALPVTAVFMNRRIPTKLALIIIVFGLAPFLRDSFGYAEKPSFPPIWKDGHFMPFEGNLKVILKHWLIDGWFPIFSWLGVAFVGAFLSEMRLKKLSLSGKDYSFISFGGMILLGIGILFWNQEFRFSARGNYSELFYPPTLTYYSAMIGASLILFVIVELISNLFFYIPLRLLGVSPLFFYFLHFLIISKWIAPFFGRTPESEKNYLNIEIFTISFGLLILFCLGISLVISLIKKKYPNPPFLVKFFIGG